MDSYPYPSDSLSGLPNEIILYILVHVPPSSLVEVGRTSRRMRGAAHDALRKARDEARAAMIDADGPTWQRALACAVVLDDLDGLERCLASGVARVDSSILQRHNQPTVRLVNAPGTNCPKTFEAWHSLSRDSTPLALAVKAGSADAVRWLACRRAPPGDAPARLLAAAIVSAGQCVEYDVCGHKGSRPYPTEAVIDALTDAFPCERPLTDVGWTEPLPFSALAERLGWFADGHVAIEPKRADAVLSGVADALGIRTEDLLSVAAMGANVPRGTRTDEVPAVREGLLRFAAAMDSLDAVAVARALIGAGYMPEAETLKVYSVLRNWMLPVGMMMSGHLSAGWSILGGAGDMPHLTAYQMNAAGPAASVFGGTPWGPGASVGLQPGDPTPERVADLLVQVVLWLLYNEPRVRPHRHCL
jgi:hypothetical protein